jgi:hypothetical protein
MKEVFRNADSGLVGLYRSMLEDAGILTFVRNDSTQQAVIRGIAAAILPIPLFYPTLCVVDDDDYPEAMVILSSLKSTDVSGTPEWKCAECGESVPGNFTGCWKCGRARDSDSEQGPLT